MEDLLLDLQVPQTPRVVITADKRVNVSCVCMCTVTQSSPMSLPGCSQKSPRRMPGHSWHSFTVTLNIRHRLIAMATRKRPRINEAIYVCFLPLPLSRFSSSTSLGSRASLIHLQHMTPGWRLIGRGRFRPVGGRRRLPRWCCVLQPSRRKRKWVIKRTLSLVWIKMTVLLFTSLTDTLIKV